MRRLGLFLPPPCQGCVVPKETQRQRGRRKSVRTGTSFDHEYGMLRTEYRLLLGCPASRQIMSSFAWGANSDLSTPYRRTLPDCAARTRVACLCLCISLRGSVGSAANQAPRPSKAGTSYILIQTRPRQSAMRQRSGPRSPAIATARCCILLNLRRMQIGRGRRAFTYLLVKPSRPDRQS